MLPFSKFVKLYILISALVIVPGIISLLKFGLKPAIDFTGGTLIEYKFDKPVDEGKIREAASGQNIAIFSIQTSNQNNLIIRTVPLIQQKSTELKKAIEEKTAESVTELRFETVGPILGRELVQKTVIAIFISIIVILLYIAWSFKNLTFGLSAVGALIHDLLVLIGTFSLFGHFFGVEIDSLFVTAVLTTTSFSVHDTIVVFHRIREIRKNNPRLPFKEASDLALSETMVRSLNNSLTIVFMLSALVLLGGPSVRWFAVALFVGTITGTYSSPFVATPLLLFLSSLRFKKTANPAK